MAEQTMQRREFVKTAATGAVHHVFLTVNDLARSRPFYAALMPRLGYPRAFDYGAVLGWGSDANSFWLKAASPEHAGATFSKIETGPAPTSRMLMRRQSRSAGANSRS